MIRKPPIVSLAAILAVSWLVTDSHDSEAQILRRLRERIQSRVNNVPPAPVAPRQQIQPPRQRTVPRYQRSPRAATPQRVAPVNPRPAARDTDPKAKASERSGLGESILDRADAPQDGSASAAESPQVTQKVSTDAEAVPDRPSLGIQVLEAQGPVRGLEVVAIRAFSKADEAGLRVGDVIVQVDGRPTPTVAEIAGVLNKLGAGARVRARVVRDGRIGSLVLPLVGGAAPREPDTSTLAIDQPAPAPDSPSQVQSALGLTVEDLDGQRGALVTELEKSSPAALSGLQTGDRIVAVDGQLLVDAKALVTVFSNQNDATPIPLRMVRDGKLMSAEIDPNADPALAESTAKSAEEDGNQSPLSNIGSLLGGLLRGSEKANDSSTEKDEMALEDDEPIQQVDFESPAETKEPDAAEAADPLSLEALDLPPPEQTNDLTPPKNSADSDANKSPEQLRKEIRELEQRLEELKRKRKAKQK